MKESEDENLLINEIELLLAQKQTHLAIFRTGAAFFGLSVTAFGALVVFIDLSAIFQSSLSLALLALLLVACGIGCWQMLRASEKITEIDSLITKMRTKNKRVAEIYFQ